MIPSSPQTHAQIRLADAFCNKLTVETLHLHLTKCSDSINMALEKIRINTGLGEPT